MVAKNISVMIGKQTPGESAGVPVHLRTLTQGGWEESTTKLSEDEFTKMFYTFVLRAKKDQKNNHLEQSCTNMQAINQQRKNKGCALFDVAVVSQRLGESLPKAPIPPTRFLAVIGQVVFCPPSYVGNLFSLTPTSKSLVTQPELIRYDK